MRRLIRSVYCGLPRGDLSSLENMSSLDEIARVAQ
jgi:acetyl-CoA synthetase